MGRNQQQKRTRGNPKFVSLFSGCGGFDIGFSKAGFSPICAYDVDSDAVNNYSLNLAGEIKQADLTNFGEDLLQKVSRADVLVAGPPCQGFSTAGKMDKNDPRNDLLPLVGHIAIAAGPRVVVVENVSGAISERLATHWKKLTAQLRLAGYATTTIPLSAKLHGVPQHRRRVLLVAWQTNRTVGDIKLAEAIPPTLQSALSKIDGLANHAPQMLVPKSREYEIAIKIAQGQKLSNVRGGKSSVHTWDIPTVFGRVTEEEKALLQTVMKLRRQSRVRSNGDADPVDRTRLEKALSSNGMKAVRSLVERGYLRELGEHVDLAHTFNGKYRRLSWEQLSPTVDTRFGEPRYFLHPDSHRGLSVREAARLQTFPDTYIFHGDLKSQYRLVGNAVPPALSFTIANFVKEYVL